MKKRNNITHLKIKLNVKLKDKYLILNLPFVIKTDCSNVPTLNAILSFGTTANANTSADSPSHASPGITRKTFNCALSNKTI